MWVNSNEKELGFGKLHRGLLQGMHKGKALGGGETVAHKGFWGSCIRNFHLLGTGGLLSGACMPRQ